MNRAERRRNRGQRTGQRSRRIVAATAIAIGGLASGYLQVLRQPTPAYASTLCTSSSITSANGLVYAIADFNDGGCDTISIGQDFALGGVDVPVILMTDVRASTALTIEGSGKTITGSNRRPFEIRMDGADTLTVSDLTITGASSDDDPTSPNGGAIAVNANIPNAGTVTLDRVAVTNSNSYVTAYTTYAYGGAAYVNADDITISDSTFADNDGGLGGALLLRLMDVSDTATIDNSAFADNYAGAQGGAVYLYKYLPNLDGTPDLTITNSTFADNYASAGGGAILGGGDISIAASSFTGNSVNPTDGDAWGGAIWMNPNYGYPSRLTVTNTFVGYNSGYYYGGISSENGTVELYFSTLYDDTIFAPPGPTFTPQPIEVGAKYLTAVGSAMGSSTANYVMFSQNTPSAVSSVTTANGVPAPSGPYFNQLSGAGNGNVDPGDFALNSIDDTMVPGQGGRTPRLTSPLVKAVAAGGFAPVANPLPAVTVDQLDDTRVSPFTIGSRRVVSSTPPEPPVPPVPSSPPRDVVAVAGDRRAVISWTEPAVAGSFPVTNYQVTAIPGGRTCLTSAPTLTCTVTGLSNGTTYTFLARALTGAGWSADSAPSNAVTPHASPSPPPPQPVPPLPAGGSSLVVDGRPAAGLAVTPNAGRDGLDVTAPGFTMTLAGLGPDGEPLPLGDDSALRVVPGARADAAGTGFAPGTKVAIYLDPPGVPESARAPRSPDLDEPVLLGSLRVAADGAFSGTVPVPADLTLGAHVLQTVGYSPAGQTRAVSLGIEAAEAGKPSIVITGSREGRRVRVQGATQGLASSTVVPRYHFAGQVRYETGFARPTITASGEFTWSRIAGRTIYVYFTADGVRSNRLILRSLR